MYPSTILLAILSVTKIIAENMMIKIQSNSPMEHVLKIVCKNGT